MKKPKNKNKITGTERNNLCICGSGKKYKFCCGNKVNLNNFDNHKVVFDYKSYFKKELDINSVEPLFSKYPVSILLDICVKIESVLMGNYIEIKDEQKFIHDHFLKTEDNVNLIDLDKYEFFTFGQLNVFRKLSILYGKTDIGLKEEINREDLFTILLSCNEIHNRYDVFIIEKENIFNFVFRFSFLNIHEKFFNMFYRGYKMFVKMSKNIKIGNGLNYYEFTKNNTGQTPYELFFLNIAFAIKFFQNKNVNLFMCLPTYYEIDYLKNIESFNNLNESSINKFIELNTKDIKELKKEIEKEDWKNNLSFSYDTSIFNKHPYIFLPNQKRIICLSIIYAFKRFFNNSIWYNLLNISEEKERTKIINDVTNYRGLLFEEYTREILNNMKDFDNNKTNFSYIKKENEEEWSDGFLWQDNNLAIFEMKSRHFSEKFKITGNFGEDKKDILKAMKQLNDCGLAIKDNKVKEFEDIEKIHPIIILYDNFPTDFKVIRYIREIASKENYFKDTIFNQLEIIKINELEDIVEILSKDLSFIDFLNKKIKHNQHSIETSFRNFLSWYLENNPTYRNEYNKRFIVLFEEMKNFFKFKNE